MDDLFFLLVMLFADVIIEMSKIDDMMEEEAKNLRKVIDALHMKHKEYGVSIQNYIRCHELDQSEIKRISGLSL